MDFVASGASYSPANSSVMITQMDVPAARSINPTVLSSADTWNTTPISLFFFHIRTTDIYLCVEGGVWCNPKLSNKAVAVPHTWPKRDPPCVKTGNIPECRAWRLSWIDSSCTWQKPEWFHTDCWFPPLGCFLWIYTNYSKLDRTGWNGPELICFI